jgi:hypothetical protein
MSITSLFVELVIGGIHTLIWISLVVLAFIGFRNLDFEKLLSINLAIPVLAVAYILGILMDRLSDIAFIAEDHRIRDRIGENYKDENLPKFLTMRFYILQHANQAYEQLEYTRSRLRISRTAILNFPLTTIALLLFVWLQLQAALGTQNLIIASAVILLSGSALTLLSYRSWVALTETYLNSTITAYQVVHESVTAENDKSKPTS